MRRLTTLIFLLVPLFTAAAADSTTGVDVRLISENSTIAAGRPFTVALSIRHHPGFHTYWRNPGIAGMATGIEWQLPDGFTASEIQWPVPENTKMAIHPVHGYEREVMLLVDITPPAAVASGDITLKATASWMACADGCFPGKTEFVLTLPVSTSVTADSAQTAAFAKARQEIPRPLLGWRVELGTDPDEPEIRLRLIGVGPDQPLPEDTYFFSEDGQVSSDQPQRFEKFGDGKYELLVRRADFSPTGKTQLPGILVSTAPLSPGKPSFARISPAYPKSR